MNQTTRVLKSSRFLIIIFVFLEKLSRNEPRTRNRIEICTERKSVSSCFPLLL
uniref:Uncharacterized protein n=1 Tax=Helianthus annuus TaxID=4232 RepID=A0A251TQR8_HELAN